MKALLLAVLLAASAASSFAQQIKVKKGLITVDGQPYARIEQDDRLFYNSSLQSQRLFVVKFMELHDPTINPVNPSSEVYLQFVFTADTAQHVVETSYSYPYFYADVVARKIYLARLIENGAVNQRALKEFSLNNGAIYSERRRALNQQLPLLPAGY